MQAQTSQKQYKVLTVAFYNVENLFDTINNPYKNDDSRTPTGADNWTSERYHDHLQKISSVIAKIGKDVTGGLPDFVGLAEIENRQVVEDLIATEALVGGNYGISHFDSPDNRGIDVAFIYKKDLFKEVKASKHFLDITDPVTGRARRTRDVLLVSGQVDGEELHFLVNHWPSRVGGEAITRPHREKAAALNVSIADSLYKQNSRAKIIGMGDFNDNPNNTSFKKVLKTVAHKNRVKEGDFYNPMELMYKKGAGTTGYADGWHLFDQFFISWPYILSSEGFSYWKAGIYTDDNIVTTQGNYRGYPNRSYVAGNYTGGYSDHFPIYLYLIKEVK